jgi:DNA-binding response OmpR family regulator
MNLLEYSVAWVEDQPNQARGHEEILRGKLARQGLNLRVQWITNNSELKYFLEQLNEESALDLILVDWKLGQMVPDGSGASVAKSIRNQNSFSNIIFYSSAPPHDLRNEIAKQLIDGVWCVNRDFFIQEARHTISANLRRLDLNSMRGLFVAAVAEFDQKMKAAIMKVYGLLEEDKKTQPATSYITRKLEFAQKNMTDIQKIDANSNLGGILEKAGTFELFALLRELNAQAGLIDSPHREVTKILGKFEEEVIIPRNDLAHAKTSFASGKATLVRGGRSYDGPRFSELRANLLQHHENLEILSEKYAAEIAAKIKTQKSQSISQS